MTSYRSGVEKKNSVRVYVWSCQGLLVHMSVVLLSPCGITDRAAEVVINLPESLTLAHVQKTFTSFMVVFGYLRPTVLLYSPFVCVCACVHVKYLGCLFSALHLPFPHTVEFFTDGDKKVEETTLGLEIQSSSHTYFCHLIMMAQYCSAHFTFTVG